MVAEGALMSVWQWFTDPANWTGPDGIPVRTAQHLMISFVAMAIAMVIALPIGLILGHQGKGEVFAVNVGNVGRAIPTFGLLIIFASTTLIGVGDWAAILALAIFAIPPLLTNTFTGLRQVTPQSVDAAAGMGMSGAQVLTKVEVPQAMPIIAAGVRTAAVQVVATASLAAFVGGGGLGTYVINGFATADTTLIIAGSILIAAISLLAELVLSQIQKAATPKGLREREPS